MLVMDHPLEELDDDVAEVVAPVPRMIEREWDDLTWQDEAACSDADTDLFFGPFMESADERDVREAFVIDALCSGCSVRPVCRDFGRRHREFGIWGETDRQRARAGYAPDTVTGRDVLRMRSLARLDREGMIAR